MQSTSVEQISEQEGTSLSGFQLQRLSQAVRGLSSHQLSWASGYLAGMGRDQRVERSPEPQQLTVLYASQTGNARSVAETLADSASVRRIAVRVLSVSDFKPRDLTKEKLLLLVISTQGEGEPPESANELHRYLFGCRAPKLEGLSFGVFGLGDSSYEHFCKAAQDFDQRLEALGGHRLLSRLDADVDFQAELAQWVSNALDLVEQHAPAREAQLLSLSHGQAFLRYGRNDPYQSTLLENRRITTQDAVAEVRHVVLEIDPDVVRYSPGDALGVWFKNDPALVDEILTTTALDAETPVEVNGETLSLSAALLTRLELTQLHPKVVTGWAGVTGDERLQALLEDPKALRTFTHGRQLIDLLNSYPAALDAASLAGLLRPLQPRLYSIASSQAEYEDEIHLTVSTLRFHSHGRDHLGGASGFLSERLAEGDLLDIYVAENSSFRLPDNGDTPIIMIGAGTGIAPYRGFLQQRQAQGDQGRNWLIFGNRHFQRDFLYQLDWQSYHGSGVLARVTPAFSRDDHHSAYVQDRIVEFGEELYRWLEEGGQLYVCGGKAMDEAVSQAVTQIVHGYGALNEEAAAAYIDNLRSQGRYQRDVY
ncbi:assimilatory sulfite reductase (NADPH) flavoprotein subunit [Candidatus Vondammii sp. HM_W22]|uniref:assimilatory sulfite reductase (NADPH) flavoprotein subunit n=1 Tax=Candidatus Vondammii sp. HM_W22 TaxID=2687299 RepID=UPI001F142416|nr:assimilatory sulfite reductase (NADPH) flavoprotein subunit [Candidatus Vondammii sp. HM_W22]